MQREPERFGESHYGRTHGDPVKALKECLKIIQDKVKADTGGTKVDIRLVSTTGSSREILGVFLETPGVYNEKIPFATYLMYPPRSMSAWLLAPHMSSHF